MKERSYLILPMLLGFILISGCVMTGSSGPQAEYFKFYNELYRNNKSLIKGKTLLDVEPSFWGQLDTIPTTLYPTKVIAYGIGKIDPFETSKGGAVGTAPLFIISGVNPVTVASSALAPLLVGPSRGKDSSFQQQIDKFIESYNWQIDEYFLQTLKKGTNLPLSRETADDFLLDRFGEPVSKTTTELGKRNVIITSMFTIMPNKMGGWTEPKYSLSATVAVTAATDEALRAFKEKFPAQPPLAFMRFDKKQAGAELRRVNAYPGMYMGEVYKNSEYYIKEQWLSNNGAFLEEQIKSAIKYLAEEADRLFFAQK